MNTRIMTLDDYDENLDTEAERLRKTLPGMRAELRRDPEGCFGGRGNNIGRRIVEETEARLNWLTNRGYNIRTHPFIDLLKGGIDLTPIEKIVARDDKLFIGGAEGYGRIKVLESGEIVEVNWVYVRGQGWRGSIPPAVILRAADAVAEFHGSTLLEWRGEFHCTRIYSQ